MTIKVYTLSHLILHVKSNLDRYHDAKPFRNHLLLPEKIVIWKYLFDFRLNSNPRPAQSIILSVLCMWRCLWSITDHWDWLKSSNVFPSSQNNENYHSYCFCYLRLGFPSSTRRFPSWENQEGSFSNGKGWFITKLMSIPDVSEIIMLIYWSVGVLIL